MNFVYCLLLLHNKSYLFHSVYALIGDVTLIARSNQYNKNVDHYDPFHNSQYFLEGKTYCGLLIKGPMLALLKRRI
ncbi:uncharacterized protein PHALS_06847 [Plasmopara halstedii]|uniref:Uncharacterized protein n=1 Tax=Plasmopara halstedii TaxID=4781 RepID=A0A0P1B508_PLAHL|nr:uncharacterized protein PHALS_06847 [Plasmopara halstedii]CEG49060.1 hypothetical protein PHALS_06847 [Plasmopara halstedii]|eukprot:XP_024585429.1 hypothetical protein PHALS_06847 [Plasmopara halstedii]